jgi:hypothetical protein
MPVYKKDDGSPRKSFEDKGSSHSKPESPEVAGYGFIMSQDDAAMILRKHQEYQDRKSKALTAGRQDQNQQKSIDTKATHPLGHLKQETVGFKADTRGKGKAKDSTFRDDSLKLVKQKVTNSPGTMFKGKAKGTVLASDCQSMDIQKGTGSSGAMTMGKAKVITSKAGGKNGGKQKAIDTNATVSLGQYEQEAIDPKTDTRGKGNAKAPASTTGPQNVGEQKAFGSKTEPRGKGKAKAIASTIDPQNLGKQKGSDSLDASSSTLDSQDKGKQVAIDIKGGSRKGIKRYFTSIKGDGVSDTDADLSEAEEKLPKKRKLRFLGPLEKVAQQGITFSVFHFNISLQFHLSQ